MKNYTKADVSEQELEDLVRRHTGYIEEGLVYVDHQKSTLGGRLDVLMVDSGKALVVAELKVIQDDGMLLQGVDYCDYVSTHTESFARLYKDHSIDPTQRVRLCLIAPSFSQTLVNRCKWLDLPISLFTFNCLKFDGEDDVVPIFSEQEIPITPPIPEVYTIAKHLAYITEPAIRAEVTSLFDEIKNWKPGSITLDAIKYSVSIKINGRLFAYFDPRRKHYIIGTYDDDDQWTNISVKDDDALTKAKSKMKAAMERKLK